MRQDARASATVCRRELTALATAAILCNEADLHERGGVGGEWVWRGDPTDIALLTMAHKLGVRREEALERAPESHRIPFEPELRYAASFHTGPHAELRGHVKGAPERVIPMCGLAPDEVRRAHELAAEMAARGLRVPAIAHGEPPGVARPMNPAA